MYMYNQNFVHLSTCLFLSFYLLLLVHVCIYMRSSLILIVRYSDSRKMQLDYKFSVFKQIFSWKNFFRHMYNLFSYL